MSSKRSEHQWVQSKQAILVLANQFHSRSIVAFVKGTNHESGSMIGGKTGPRRTRDRNLNLRIDGLIKLECRCLEEL